MPHNHDIIDSDKHFVIDPVTKQITTTSEKLTLITGDHNSERYTFEIPKIVEGHDMSTCAQVEIHFNNISSSSSVNKGVYLCEDVQVVDDNLTFSWLISREATKYSGSLVFSIRFICIDEEKSVVYDWRTGIYKSIKIADTVCNSAVVEETVPDYVSKIKQEITEDILGNVPIEIPQADWNQNDETADDYVKNRPGGYLVRDEINITWDGNTEGLTSVQLADNMSVYKISDVIFTADEAIGMTVTFSDGNSFNITRDDLNVDNNNNDIFGIQVSKVLIALVILKDNLNVEGIIFTEAGIYTTPALNNEGTYIQNIHKDQTYVKISEDLLDLSNFKSEFNTLSDNVDSLYNSNAALAYSEAKSAKTIAEAAKTAASNAVGADVVKGNYILRSGQLLYTQCGFSVLFKRNGTEELLSHLGYDRLTFNPKNDTKRMCLTYSSLELGNAFKPKSIRLYAEIESSSSSSIEIWDSNGDSMTIKGDGSIDAPDKIIKFGSSHMYPNILRYVKSPELSYDAVNKEYVDNRISGTEITLNSSTSGSTKQFKLTIDDTGVVTATDEDGKETALVSDDHINSLIDTKLGVIENGTY